MGALAETVRGLADNSAKRYALLATGDRLVPSMWERRGCSSRPGPARPPGAAAFTRFASEGWWAREGSNLQPDGYEPPALTS
jgi:hypothetical protein